MRRRFTPLLLSGASVVTCLGLLELVLRLGGYGPTRLGPTLFLRSPERNLALDCYPSNPRGYFDVDLRDPQTLARYQALNVHRIERAAPRAPFAVEVRYNSLGFRGPEVGPRRPGVRRVAVLGDSFTEGKGVKLQDTYPQLLEALLNARQPGRWEVLNCGRRASDFPELYEEFHEVLRLEPDLLVYGMVLNDAERSPELQARFAEVADLIEDREQGDRARRYARLGPFESRLAASIEDRLEAASLRRVTLSWYRDVYGPANDAGWQRTRQHIRNMDAEMKARGGGFLLALWPLLADLDGRYPLPEVSRRVAELCAESGIRCLDLLDALRGHSAESLWVHPLDRHPNESAHRLVAGALAPVVLGGSAEARPR